MPVLINEEANAVTEFVFDGKVWSDISLNRRAETTRTSVATFSGASMNALRT